MSLINEYNTNQVFFIFCIIITKAIEESINSVQKWRILTFGLMRSYEKLHAMRKKLSLPKNLKLELKT